MNAVLTQVAVHDHTQRNAELRRRNAESAYHRNGKYNGENQEQLKKLEEFLRGKNELETVQPEKPKSHALGAGQVKQIAIPVGKTLEETIAIWSNVRREAHSVPEPTAADLQLAAIATPKIMRAEAQIALHNYAHSEIARAALLEEAETAKIAFMELPSKLDYEVLETQRRYEKAISSYSFQIQMKQKGFELEWPSFYQVA